MKGAENMEMEPDPPYEDNIYANTCDLDVRRMRKTPKAKAAKNTQHRVILTLGVLLILVFLVVVILISLLFIYYNSTQKEILQMKNDSDVKRNSTDVIASDVKRYSMDEVIDSDVKHNLTDRALAYFSSNIQRILGFLGKVAEELQKLKNSSNPLCSEGWIHYGLSCYYLSSDSQPWNVSKKDCEEREAHLIVINSKGEMNFLRTIAKGRRLWIGLMEEDGTWRWVDGTPYDITPKFWGKGQPDDWKDHGFEGGEDCIELRKGDEWNDSYCSKEILYVCEKKIVF